MSCKRTAKRACKTTVKTKAAKASAVKYPTRHEELIKWVNDFAKLTQAKNVHWCDGTKKEYNAICESMVESGAFVNGVLDRVADDCGRVDEDREGRAAATHGSPPGSTPGAR